MRILFIQVTGGRGGSKNSLLAGLKSLMESHEHRVTVLCGQEGWFPEECRMLGVDLVCARLPAWRKAFERLLFSHRLKNARAALGAREFDVIIANELRWAPHAVKLAVPTKARSAVIIRDTNATGRKAGKYGLKRVDAVVCVSRVIRDELEKIGIPRDRLGTVYNPIVAPRMEATRVPGWKQDRSMTRWVGHIGDLNGRKNPIEAVYTLFHLRRIDGPHWGLALAGEGEPEYCVRLNRVIRELGLTDAVVMLGYVDPVEKVLAQVDAIVLTSVREGLPRTLAEGLMGKTPSFSFGLPGLGELYGGFSSMFVPETPSAEKLARLMLETLSDPALPATLDELGERLKARHDPSTYSERLLAAISETVPDSETSHAGDDRNRAE